MIYILFCLFYFISVRKKSRITIFLFSMLLFSSVGAYLIGRKPEEDMVLILCTFFTAILLYILFRSFDGYRGITELSSNGISSQKLFFVERFITILGYGAFFLYLFVLSRVLPQLMQGMIIVEEFKNQGEAADYWAMFLPHYFITISNFITPLGYFALSLHFYYLIKQDKRKSIRYFIISLIIILSGLIALSRARTVQFAINYVAIFLFISPLMSHKSKRLFVRVGSIFAVGMVVIMLVISNARFSDSYSIETNNNEKHIVDESEQPVLASTLDYFAQWEEFSAQVIQDHEIGDASWGMFSCSGLLVHIQKIIYGADKVNKERTIMREKRLGRLSTSFLGLIAYLVCDFGFLGSFVFIYLFSFLIKRFAPKNGVLSFKTLVALPVLFPVCGMFWCSNELSEMFLDIGMIYSLVLYKWISIPKNEQFDREIVIKSI